MSCDVASCHETFCRWKGSGDWKTAAMNTQSWYEYTADFCSFIFGTWGGPCWIPNVQTPVPSTGYHGQCATGLQVSPTWCRIYGCRIGIGSFEANKKRAKSLSLYQRSTGAIDNKRWTMESNIQNHPDSKFLKSKTEDSKFKLQIPPPRSIYQNPRTQKSNIQNQSKHVSSNLRKPIQVLPWYLPHIVSLLRWSNNRVWVWVKPVNQWRIGPGKPIEGTGVCTVGI